MIQCCLAIGGWWDTDYRESEGLQPGRDWGTPSTDRVRDYDHGAFKK
jgi:hypothetical protein